MVARETSISSGLRELGLPASLEQIASLARFAEILVDEAIPAGFLGPNEAGRVVSRHLLEAASLVQLLTPASRVADVGSGAGLPGLVLALLGFHVSLVEAHERRAAFLLETARRLGCGDRVEVIAKRAEDAARTDLRDAFPAACARALAAPAVAFELCLPFVRPGGALVLLAEPKSGDDGAGLEVRMGDHSGSDPERMGGGDTGPADDRQDDVLGAESDRADGPPRARASPRTFAPEAVREDDRGNPPPGPAPALPGGSGSEGPDLGSGSAREADRKEAGALPRVADTLVAVARELGGAEPAWRELLVPGATTPRWVMIVGKVEPTPQRYPRRAGVPHRRPLA